MYLMTLSGTRYLTLFPLLTAVLILVELTKKTRYHTSLEDNITTRYTIICDPLSDDVDVVPVSGQEIRVVDEFLRV